MEIRPKETNALRKKTLELLNSLESLMHAADPVTAQKAAQLLSWYEKPVRQALADLKPAENSLYWRLSSPSARNKVYASCSYLIDVISVGLGPEIRNLQKR